jgi:hypothetical protein
MLAPPRPPSHDELEALIKEARERQLRRRLLGAAGVAIVAAVGLAAYALVIGGGDRASKNSTPGASAAPPCRSSELSVSAIWDGGGGNLFNFFTIANKGAGPCSLPLERPAVFLVRHGAPLKIDERPASHGLFPGRPVSVLAPGRRAVVHLDWFNWCGPNVPLAQTATTVTVRFADGLRLTAPHLLGQPPCMAQGRPSVLTVSRLLTPS